MELKDKVVVVTGGAGGIGSALCRRFAPSNRMLSAQRPQTRRLKASPISAVSYPTASDMASELRCRGP